MNEQEGGAGGNSQTSGSQEPGSQPQNLSGSGRRQILPPSFVPAAQVADPSEQERDRSRSPHGADGATPSAPRANPNNQLYQDIQKLVQEEMGSQLPAHVTSAIKRITSKFVDRVQSLQSTNDFVNKLQGEITELGHSRLPKTVKKFGVAFEAAELDEHCEWCINDTFVFGSGNRTETQVASQIGEKLEFAQGDTYRECKKKLYMWYLHQNKLLEIEAYRKHAANLRTATKFEKFRSDCRAEVDPGVSARNALGLDIDPTLWDDDDPKLEAKIRVLYKKSVEQLTKDKLAKQASETKEKKAKEAIVAKTQQNKPVDHLNALIDSKVDERLAKGKSKSKAKAKSAFVVDQAALFTDSINPNTMVLDVEQYVTPAAKNGAAPSGAQSGQKGGKSRGKGGKQTGKGDMGNPSAKAKSKAKAKPKAKQTEDGKNSKGKGSGKGKGKKGKK